MGSRPVRQAARVSLPFPISLAAGFKHDLERVKGIEPSSSAWKAVALPLSYTRRSASILFSPSRGWWRGLDSNQRRHSQRVYSPSPLATRAPLRPKAVLSTPSKPQKSATISARTHLVRIVLTKISDTPPRPPIHQIGGPRQRCPNFVRRL